MSDLPDWLSKEAFKHPLVVWTAIVATSGALGSMMNPFVLAEDFDTFQVANTKAGEDRFIAVEQRFHIMEESICDVRRDVRSESLETQLRSVESDIWTLEPIVSNGNGNERDAKRLRELRSDMRQLNTQIGDLSSTHDCTANHGTID